MQLVLILQPIGQPPDHMVGHWMRRENQDVILRAGVLWEQSAESIRLDHVPEASTVIVQMVARDAQRPKQIGVYEAGQPATQYQADLIEFRIEGEQEIHRQKVMMAAVTPMAELHRGPAWVLPGAIALMRCRLVKALTIFVKAWHAEGLPAIPGNPRGAPYTSVPIARLGLADTIVRRGTTQRLQPRQKIISWAAVAWLTKGITTRVSKKMEYRRAFGRQCVI